MKFFKLLFVLSVVYSQLGVSVAKSSKLKALQLCKNAFEIIQTEPSKKPVFFRSFSENFKQKFEDDKTMSSEIYEINHSSEGYLKGVLTKDSNLNLPCQIIMNQDIVVSDSFSEKTETIDLVILHKKPAPRYERFNIKVDAKVQNNEVTVYAEGQYTKDGANRIGNKNTSKKSFHFNKYVRYIKTEVGSNPAIVVCARPCSEELERFQKNVGLNSLSLKIKELKELEASDSSTDELQVLQKVDKYPPLTISSFIQTKTEELLESLEYKFLEFLAERGVVDKVPGEEAQTKENFKRFIKEFKEERQQIENDTTLSEKFVQEILKQINLLETKYEIKKEEYEKLAEIKGNKLDDIEKTLEGEKEKNKKFKSDISDLENTISNFEVEVGNFKTRNFGNPVNNLFKFNYLFENETVESNSVKEHYQFACEIHPDKTIYENLRLIGENQDCISFEHEIYEEKGRVVKISKENGGRVSLTVYFQKKQEKYISSITLTDEMEKDIREGCNIEIAFERNGEKTEYKLLFSNTEYPWFSFTSEDLRKKGFTLEQLRWEGTQILLRPSTDSTCKLTGANKFELYNLSDPSQISTKNPQITIKRDGALEIKDLGMYESKPVLNIFLASHIGVKDEANIEESTHEEYPFHPYHGLEEKGLSQESFFMEFLEIFDEANVKKDLFDVFSGINFLVPVPTGNNPFDFNWKVKAELNSNSHETVSNMIGDSWLHLPKNYLDSIVANSEVLEDANAGRGKVLIYGQGGLKRDSACHLGELEELKNDVLILRTVGLNPKDRDSILTELVDEERLTQLPKTYRCLDNDRLMLMFPTLSTGLIDSTHIEELGKKIIRLTIGN